MPLTPLKSVTNKRKRKCDVSDDDSTSDDDNQQDEDYDDKYVNRKIKQEGGSKRQQSKDEANHEDIGELPHMLPAIQIPLDSSKSSDELDFLIRLNTFMAERSLTYPKLVWGLRDGELIELIKLKLCNRTEFSF